MRPIPLLPLLLPAVLAAAQEDKPIVLTLHVERATAMYQVQGVDLDHPLGEALKFAGATYPVRMNEKGQPEIDLKGDGTFKALAKGTLSLPYFESINKKAYHLEVFVSQRPDKTWVYRDVSVLLGQIGTDKLTIIDVDGDGTFNEPGIDAVALGDKTWAFPLPADTERWCTATLDLTGLSLLEWGQTAKLEGRPLATTVAETLPLLKAINDERNGRGLTPRPEDTTLSAALQKHCHYMVGTGVLAHPEEPGKPGFTAEGNEAGQSSILSMGTAAEGVARMMVSTLYHRQDVVRPDTLRFGVGYEGRFGGIDGRRAMGKAATWPVLVPTPDETDVPLEYQHEMPDAIGEGSSGGFPITAYFAKEGAVLKSWKLEAAGGGAVDCWTYDANAGGKVDMNHWQRVVALIAKAPLAANTQYRVSMTVDVGGTAWEKAWNFTTGHGVRPGMTAGGGGGTGGGGGHGGGRHR